MIITEVYYNDPISGESVSKKKVEQIEPSDTINVCRTRRRQGL